MPNLIILNPHLLSTLPFLIEPFYKIKTMRLLTLFFFPLFVLLQSCGSSSDESTTQPPESAKNVKSKDPLTIDQVVAQARIEPEGKIAKLASPVDGIVVNIRKEENDHVLDGEVIVELDHQIESVKLAQAQAKLATQQAKVTMYRFELNEFEAKVKNKEKEFNRLINLLKSGSETQQRVDDMETDLSVLKSSLKKAEANLEVVTFQLAEIRSEVELTQRQLDQRYLKAPAKGQLISMNAVIGASIDTQSPFAEFIPTGKIIARAEVDELFATKIKVGQKVVVRLVGREEELTTGIVFYVAPTLKKKSLFSEKAGDQEDRRVREIKIELAQEDKLLINSRIECVIKIQ
jgi:multidrug efflux pump subunit AcrA (membrane-fusion protein)